MAKKIVSLQHPIVKHLVKLRQSAHYRREAGTVLIIGGHLVQEVCPHHEIKRILMSKEIAIPLPQHQDVYHVTAEILKKISGVQHFEGVIAEVAMPKEETLEGCRYVVAFDNIRDPGNLGTLLRTALALGWEGVFLLENSCDPYNDKALRAAKGATFRLPLRSGNWQELFQLVKDNHLTPLAADVNGQSVHAISLKEPFLLVLGSEAHGLSPEAEIFCKKITIPMSDAMESLNVSVAGGILMYMLKGKLGSE